MLNHLLEIVKGKEHSAVEDLDVDLPLRLEEEILALEERLKEKSFKNALVVTGINEMIIKTLKQTVTATHVSNYCFFEV